MSSMELRETTRPEAVSPTVNKPASRQKGANADGFGGSRFSAPSGWLRFEEGWLDTGQTLKNLETVVSLLQKAKEGLGAIDNLINDMMTEVNEGLVNADWDDLPPVELKQRVRTRLNQINEIVRQSRFHGRGLLDGQCGVRGVGNGVDYIRGGSSCESSPPEGYEVRINVLPSRPYMLGGVPFTEDWLSAEEEIFLAEGENFVRCQTSAGETVTDFLERLKQECRAAALEVEVQLDSQQRLVVRHYQYGSQSKFKGSSTKTPLLSKRPGKVEWSRKGRDIQGTINKEPAFGLGRMLIGYLDNPNTSELAVVWRGGRLEEGWGGRVYVVQSRLQFQDGEDQARPPVRIGLPSFHTTQQGRWMDTPSAYGALDDMRFDTWQELRDSLHLLFAVSCEMDDWKANIKSWVKRYQNMAMACLRRGSTPQGVLSLADPAAAKVAERMALQLKDLIARGNS